MGTDKLQAAWDGLLAVCPRPYLTIWPPFQLRVGGDSGWMVEEKHTVSYTPTGRARSLRTRGVGGTLAEALTALTRNFSEDR